MILRHLLLLLTASVLIITTSIHAQTPQSIPYQSVARNAAGNLLGSQNLSIRFTIHQATANGTILYRETHNVTTNSLGLFTALIGQGTPVTGTLAGVNWGSGAKFLQVEMDASGGTNYINMGTTQMTSVPYALYAETANVPGVAGPAGTNGKTVLNGTVNPTPGNGVDGDFYINTTTKQLFGPKASGAWGSGTSLIGPAGATGAQGIQGLTGPQGATGVQGPQGIQGVVGATGAAGANGKTVLNGTVNPTAGNGVDGDFYINTTTKQLFGPKTSGVWGSGTSLIGPTGATGAQGIQGLTGPQGATGVQGPQGIQGVVGATGPQGIQGVAGAAGTNGKTVLNGTVNPTAGNGVDGDFYINTTTKQLFGPKTSGVWGSGTSLIGPTGATGAQGIQGATGPQGIQGLTGNTGSQGPQGIQGVAGPTGPQGVQGTTGATGPAGSANISGAVNNLIKFTGTTTGGNSQIFDNATNVGIGTSTPSAKLDVNGQIKIQGGTPGSGKILTSDASGLATWQLPGADSQWASNGANIFNKNSGNVGIGISTPKARLHVADSAVVFSAVGDTSITNFNNKPPIEGSGRRMMWYPERGAFRAGGVASTNWNSDSIGAYSVAMGWDTKAKGSNAVSFGHFTTASGNSSTAMGFSTTASGVGSIALGGFTDATGITSTAMGDHSLASGDQSTSMGRFSVASGLASTAMGFQTVASGDYSTAIGAGTNANGIASIAMGFNTAANGDRANSMGSVTTANGFASLVIGQYNDSIVTAQSSMQLTTPLFIIGNGTSSNARKNAMIVRNDGRLGLGTNTPAARLHIADSSVVFSAVGDTSITTFSNKPPIEGEGRRMMWYPERGAFRAGGVAGIDSLNWNQDSIGAYSVAMGWNTLAKGRGSVAIGSNTNARGTLSTAMGSGTTASNQNSTAMGVGTTANGFSSTAFGNSTSASGGTSTAMGFDSKAIGTVSTAMGDLTTASGDRSTAMGQGTNANGFASLAIGRFNDSIIAAQTSMQATTPLFMVGNGTSVIARSNAMVVRNDGNVGIGTSAPAKRLHVVDAGTSGGAPYSAAGLVLESNTSSYLQLLTPDASDNGILFGIASNSRSGGILYNAAGNKGFQFRTNGNSTKMVIDSNGNMGLGNITPTFQLQLSTNSAAKPSSSTWSISSDARLKTIDGKYDKGLADILQLNTIAYHYKKGNARHLPTDEQGYGFIAQDVQKVFPEAVKENADGYLSIDLHPVLVSYINAFKELNTKIGLLEKQNELLINRLEALEKK